MAIRASKEKIDNCICASASKDLKYITCITLSQVDTGASQVDNNTGIGNFLKKPIEVQVKARKRKEKHQTQEA